MDLEVEAEPTKEEEPKRHKKHRYKRSHRHNHRHVEEERYRKDGKHRFRRNKHKDKHRDLDSDKYTDKLKSKGKDEKKSNDKEKDKGRRRSSKSHKKKRSRLGGDDSKKSTDKSRRRKRKKVKEKAKQLVSWQDPTLDLSTLTKHEVKALRKVIRKDEAEMRAMDMKVSVIRTEIEELRQLNAPSNRGAGNSMCPRCGKQFPGWQSVLPFVDKGVRCDTCKYLVCKSCRHLQPNGLFICRLCICYRQERLLTGDWMEPTDAGVHSTDLIKLSLRDKKKLKKRREKDGFFGDSKKRHHHSRKKTSRSKSKKSRDENTSHRRHKHHRRVRDSHESHTGKETAAKNQREFRSKSHIGLRSESLKERGKDCLPEKKNQKQKEDVAEEEQKEQNQEDEEEEEGSAIFIEDELCYIDEPFADDEYFNNDEDDNDYDEDDEYYGAEYWENLYYFDDDGETYDYDGYYFHGEAGDEDYEEEAFDNPEKEDLALEVSLGHEAWASASLDGSGRFNKHRQLQSSLCAAKTEQAGLTQYFPAQDLSASAGDVRMTCLDYLPMIEPPPYQERCPYVGCDIPGASSNPRSLDLPPVPAYRESPASVTPLNKKLKAGRKNLPLWKRFKCSVKETFRFVMPRFIRRNRRHDIEKMSPEVTEDDADGDGYGEHNGASVKMKKGEEKDNNENKEEPVSLEDINWNFQPQGGGPQHGGGRKGVRRPIRGRGRGRGRRGMRGRGMRGRGRGIRGMPFRGRGMRAPRRGVAMRGDKSGRPPRGATVPGTATFKDRDKDRDRRRDKAREHKHRKMSSKSSKQVSSAIGDLQKKLRAVDDRGRVSVRTKQKRPKEPRDGSRGKSMSVVYYCPPKDTESVASQTSKPPRSKLMEFFCPFCRFNVEWT